LWGPIRTFYLRERDPVAATEVEEEILGGTQGAGVLVAVKGEGSAKLGRAGASDAHGCIERAEVE